MDFGQPNGIARFTAKSALLKILERQVGIFGAQKQIQVLGIAPNSGMLAQRESTRNRKRNLLLFEQCQNFLKKSALLFWQFGRRRRGEGRRFITSLLGLGFTQSGTGGGACGG